MNTQERAHKILSQPGLKVGTSVCVMLTKEADGIRETATAFIGGGDSVYCGSIDELEQKIGDIEAWRRQQAMDRIEKLRIEIARATEALA